MQLFSRLGYRAGMTEPRPDEPSRRRLALSLPSDLVLWVQAAAEISHRTVDDVVSSLIGAERSRWEENWDPTGGSIAPWTTPPASSGHQP